VVDPARHRQLQPGVVDDVVELRDEGKLAVARGIKLRCMADEEQRDRETNRDPYDVLFQGLRP